MEIGQVNVIFGRGSRTTPSCVSVTFDGNNWSIKSGGSSDNPSLFVKEVEFLGRLNALLTEFKDHIGNRRGGGS